MKASWTYEELTKLTMNLVTENNATAMGELFAAGVMMFWFRLTLQSMSGELLQEERCLLH